MAEDSESGRKLRAKERKKYIDQEIDEDDIDGRRMYSVEEKLVSEKFNADMVQELKGPEFTMEWMQRNGLTRPIVFYDKTGLGLRVPSENFKVSDVKQCVGSRRILDVMDVTTQKAMEMSMKDWVKYYENPERDRLLNVISLEFCHTRLENYVESPTLVRQVDWVDRAWPRHLKECQTESTNVIEKMKYPKVQKYCLMSVAGCYTDFHIDFGGTSVWYHILHGEKIFWLAPPSQQNIERYTEWTLSAKQGDTFLGDTLEQCQRINLCAGSTFIIPSGWIHAVYTPKDSLVFGGNFLHSFNIENQLLVSRVEDKTYVPSKFRYPFFSEIMWYVVDRYLSCLTGRSYLSSCEKEKEELDEDDQGLIQVDEDSRPPSRNPDSRPPSRAMDDSMDAKQIKSESGEDAPKLSKSVTIELTRIDQALRRSQSEDENQPPLAKPRVPRKAVSDSNSSWEGGGGTRKWIHLTPTELKGLHQLVDYLTGLMALPPNKRGVPREMLDPEAVLKEIRQVLEDHKNDDPELAVTGEPDIGWPESAKKKQQKLKLGYKTFKTAKAAKGPTGSSSSSSIRRRRTRCKQCEACTRTECGECTFCKDMKKFGGPGRMKQTCISRQCMAPVLPSSSVCMICNQEGQPNPDDSDDVAHTLMECGICWEIVHPTCLQKKYENLDNDGVVNEDLPNSWECSKCCNEGKQGQLKPRVRPGVSTKKVKMEEHRFSPESDGALEEDPISPISPVEGKRVVSKEGGRPKNGVGDEPFIKTELGAPKWPSPLKKIPTPPDVKVKSEDGPPSPQKSMPSSQSREDSQKKRNTPQLPLKDQKKQNKKEKISAPNSPSSSDNKHPRKRPTSTPSSSGEKNTASSQLTESGGKRPKRESDTIGGSCERDKVELEACNSKTVGLDTERRRRGASKKGRPKALTLQKPTSEPQRAALVQYTRARGRPPKSAGRSASTMSKHFSSVGDSTTSIKKPKSAFISEIRADRDAESNSNDRDAEFNDVGVECNSSIKATVFVANSDANKSSKNYLSVLDDGKKTEAMSVTTHALNSTREKLTNIFDISFATTTSSPPPAATAACFGSQASQVIGSTSPKTITDAQSATAASQPVTTTAFPSTKLSDNLFKKPQDYSCNNAKFIVVNAKSPLSPPSKLSDSPHSGPPRCPFSRPPQSPRSISSLPLVPSWFQPTLVSSSVSLSPSITQKATVISPELVFKKSQILNGVYHPVPLDHPYSKEPSVA